MNIHSIWKKILNEGTIISPRGSLCKELKYVQFEITDLSQDFPSRNFNLDYAKREFQWYLTADKFNLDICKYAKLWIKIIQNDNSINSNYGQYWFRNNGFKWVTECLTIDPDSRQAYIPMLGAQHMFPSNKDVVCTKGIQFSITDDMLDMHVAMRSSDAVYGMATDLLTFKWLQEMVACDLNVDVGRLIFSADSLHIYEKHFDLVETVVNTPEVANKIIWPAITDVKDLLDETYESLFGKWLTEVKL